MKISPKFQVNDLVRTADIKRTFSKGNITDWYNLCTNTEIINDTIPKYKLDNLRERYNEALLKMTELTLKEKDSLRKELNLN